MGHLTVVDVEDVYRASVGELLRNFRDALLAVTPIADRAKINYRDEDTHRDWERLSESLFDAFVRSPINSDRLRTGDELPLARYDVDVDDYFRLSWLSIDHESPHRAAVVRFLSEARRFDTVQVVEIDPASMRAGRRTIVPFDGARFVLYRRRESGEPTIVDQVEAEE